MTELETRIRSTLRARADDIDPSPPAWEDLVERSGAVVVPLRPGDGTLLPAHLSPSHQGRTPRPWLRPFLAAAAALAVVLGATVLVETRGGNSGDNPGDNGLTIVRQVPDTPVIPSPLSEDFAQATATAFPAEPGVPTAVTGDDPEALAASYLSEVGIDNEQLARSGFERWTDPPTFETVATATGSVETARVWWSIRQQSDTRFPVTIGPVYMRRNEGGLWVVVGAGTSNNMSLSGVRRAERGVWLTVGDYLENPYVQVRVGGEVVYEGELGDDYSQTFSPPDPAPGKVITIEVQHLEDGQPVSITAMALAPAEADPVPTTATIPPTTPPAISP